MRKLPEAAGDSQQEKKERKNREERAWKKTLLKIGDSLLTAVYFYLTFTN